jgi:hypothetical protein
VYDRYGRGILNNAGVWIREFDASLAFAFLLGSKIHIQTRKEKKLSCTVHILLAA